MQRSVNGTVTNASIRYEVARRTVSCILLLCSLGLRGQSTAGMVPFTMDHRSGAQGRSPVDVSFLLDAPAGKQGFIKVVDGHLATPDGKRIRFWGVNLTDWSKGSRQIPSKQDAPFWAATLARFGVNAVRLQFLDLPTPRGLVKAGEDTRSLDAEALDREDYFLAELEKRGIYIDFNLLVGRPFKVGDGVQDAALLREGAKGTSLFDKRMIELQKEYARELLTHRNPYTRHKYTDDPAVAIVEINNENAIDVGFRMPSSFYQDELSGLYNHWLVAHRDADQIARLRMLGGVAASAPVPLIQSRGEKATAASERLYAEAAFFNDLERDYFAEMESYLKHDLGSQSLVIATADHNHAASGYPLLRAEQSMNIIDGHTYWQHPESYVHKLPMVNDPDNSTVVELSRSAIAGKPYIVSEVNNAFPNDYGGEGIPILAAYGALQDWDGIFWYTFEPKIDPQWKPYVGDPFDVSLDPVKMPEIAAGALMFLRGDIEHARETSMRVYSEKQVFDSMLLPVTDRPFFTPGFSLALPLAHEVRIASLDGAAAPSLPAFSAANPVSDTGQLSWYRSPQKTGLVTIDAPRSEALIGFMAAHGNAVSHLAASLDNAFASLLLSSIDEQPIASSTRLLLVAGGRVENTGQQWNPAGTDLTRWGEAPTLIEQVKGTITLRNINPARAVYLQPLGGGGKPLGKHIAAVKASDGWSLTLESPVTTWYQILVER